MMLRGTLALVAIGGAFALRIFLLAGAGTSSDQNLSVRSTHLEERSVFSELPTNAEVTISPSDKKKIDFNCDLGEVFPLTAYNFRIKILNDKATTVRLTKIQFSCRCLSGSLENDRILPGGYTFFNGHGQSESIEMKERFLIRFFGYSAGQEQVLVANLYYNVAAPFAFDQAGPIDIEVGKGNQGNFNVLRGKSKRAWDELKVEIQTSDQNILGNITTKIVDSEHVVSVNIKDNIFGLIASKVILSAWENHQQIFSQEKELLITRRGDLQPSPQSLYIACPPEKSKVSGAIAIECVPGVTLVSVIDRSKQLTLSAGDAVAIQTLKYEATRIGKNIIRGRIELKSKTDKDGESTTLVPYTINFSQ